MVALPKPRPLNPTQQKFQDDIERELGLAMDSDMADALAGRIPVLPGDTGFGSLSKRAEEAGQKAKGFAVGVPAGLAGLPADIIALPSAIGEILAKITGQDPRAAYLELSKMDKGERDANLMSMTDSPQEFAALSGFFDSREEGDDVMPLNLPAEIGKRFGAESVARGMGFGEELDEPGFTPFRQGMLAGELIADPALVAGGISKLLKTVRRTPDLGPSEEPFVIPEEVAQQPTRLQATGDIVDEPTTTVPGLEPDDAFAAQAADVAEMEEYPEDLLELVDYIFDEDRPGPVGAPDTPTTTVPGMEEVDLANLPPEPEGIATLPAAEDVIDVEPVAQAALTPIRTEGQQILRQEAFPITEDVASLPSAPKQPSFVQGEIIDYTPVYRQLSMLDENQTYTPKGLAQLLRALPTSARRDLYNLPAIDDPNVVALNELNYDLFLRSRNQDKPFDQFVAERNASRKKAPDFIKLKKNDEGEFVFDKEIKKSNDPDPRKNIQRVPQSGILKILDDMVETGVGDVPLDKQQVIDLYNAVSPQIAVKSIKRSDVIDVPQGMTDEQFYSQLENNLGITKSTATKVDSIVNMQNPFRGSSVNDPTVMIFSNPADNAQFLGKPLEGVPAHNYFGGESRVPGYIGHVRYDDVLPLADTGNGFQPTGERYAGYVEGQSNLQSALRGSGDDFQSAQASGLQATTPEMSLFLSTVEKNFDDAGIKVAIDAQIANKKAESDLYATADPIYPVRQASEKLTLHGGRHEDILAQPSENYGSNGSRVKVLGDAANDIADVIRDAPFDAVSGTRSDFMDYVDQAPQDVEDKIYGAISYVENDFVNRNGYTSREFERMSEIDSGADRNDVVQNHTAFMHELLFDLAEVKANPNTSLADVLGIMNTTVQRGRIPRLEEIQMPEALEQIYQTSSEKLNFALANRAEHGFSGYDSANMNAFLNRPGVEYNQLADMINREGVFSNGVITYRKLENAFGGPENADAAVMMIRAMHQTREGLKRKDKATLIDVLAKPLSIQEGVLPETADSLEVLDKLLRHGTDDEIEKIFLSSDVNTSPNTIIRNAKRDNGVSVRDYMRNRFLEQPPEQRDALLQLLRTEHPNFAYAVRPSSLALVPNQASRSMALDEVENTQNRFIAAARNIAEDPTGLDSSYGSFSKKRAAQNIIQSQARNALEEGFATNQFVTPPGYDQDELIDMVEQSLSSSYGSGPQLLVPTPFSNSAQMNHYLYRSFIQEAVKKGYDGVVFPSWQVQKNAHSMDSDEVAKLTYGKALKEAIDIIRKDHPEFPTYESLLQSNFKFQGPPNQLGRTKELSGDSVVLKFTPEIKAIFEDRVIRRAKGGEVDLRPKKMIHSGIGAMAREMM